MSKIESGKMEVVEKTFNLKELLEDTVEEFQYFANERGVGLSRAEDINHETVISDPLRLREVIGNLIGNAIKFTNAAGWVVLIVEEEIISENQSRFTFKVKDTGCGISRENQALIFDAFEQGSNGQHYGKSGSGLGLAICKNLVELLGGELLVKSREGDGAEFTFTIPMETMEKKIRKKKGAVIQEISYQGSIVLLVEDNELNADIAQNFLRAYGFTVDANGKEAMERYQNSEEGYYALILMDIRMPVMDGYEAARKIRSSGRADAVLIPILAMSANAFSEDVQASMDAGMNDHIAKPVDMQTLNYKLNKVLNPQRPKL